MNRQTDRDKDRDWQREIRMENIQTERQASIVKDTDRLTDGQTDRKKDS